MLTTKNSLPLLLGMSLAVCTCCTRPPQQAAPPLRKVTVSTPQLTTVTNWDEYPGHIEAVEMVEIRPRVSGYIDSIHFEDGAEVKAGDLLFIIDPKPYQAELDRVRAERFRADTRLELAQNDLKRVESLRGTRAISEEEYDGRSKAVREGEAALAATKAAEAVAQLNLGYTQVKAPINGRIGRRLVTVGNLVQGGGGMPATVLATLVSMDPVYCYFDAEESAFLKYRRNHPPSPGAGLKDAPLACELALVNEAGFPHPGRLDFFDNQVDAKTGTLRLRGTFTNPDRSLVPGMFARVRVPAGAPGEAMLVPAVALIADQDQKYVLIVNQESLVERRDIKIARRHGVQQVVTGGLTVQDRVVVNGQMLARPGSKVEVVEASAPGPGPVKQAQR